MGVSITQSAAKHVAGQLHSRGKGLGIRLGVTTSGCSGMAYVLEFVDEVQPEDQVFEDHGVKVFIDPKSMVYLDGTELDFVREGLPIYALHAPGRFVKPKVRAFIQMLKESIPTVPGFTAN